MFRLGKSQKKISPVQLVRMLCDETVTLIDVRETAEFAAGHIGGALNLPLARFDVGQLPRDGRRLVLYCAAGGRSRVALARCRGIRNDVDNHLAGGIRAWSRAQGTAGR